MLRGRPVSERALGRGPGGIIWQRDPPLLSSALDCPAVRHSPPFWLAGRVFASEERQHWHGRACTALALRRLPDE